MKNLLFSLFWGLTIASCQPVSPPTPIHPLPTSEQIAWHKMEMYAFVHFGLNTFNDLEWGFGDTPAETFNPSDLDVDQWVRLIKSAGFKGIILTAKHHDGFCLWQTKYTDYSVKNSPWRNGKGDMVSDLIAACKAEGLKVGLYLSPWDRHQPSYGSAEYVDYFHNQIAELINNYCNDIELFEYWFDGANGGDGYYGGAREHRNIEAKFYYRYADAIKIIHDKFPNAMIFGETHNTIRWVGNEAGWAGQTNWAPYSSDQEKHHTERQWGHRNGKQWLPAEVDVSIRPGWFYHRHEDQRVKTLYQLQEIYYNSVGRNANLILNFPVALSGKIHTIDSTRIMEWRALLNEQFKTNITPLARIEASNERGRGFEAERAVDSNWDTYWAVADGDTASSITLNFEQFQHMSMLLLQEYIPLGQRVERFAVHYLNQEGGWVSVNSSDSLTTVGYKRIVRFEPISTKSLRVTFIRSKGPVCINNMELYMANRLSKQSQGLTYNKEEAGLILPKTDLRAALFDGDISTSYTLPVGEEEVVLDLPNATRLRGITYLPSVHSKGALVSHYTVLVDGEVVASGEFGNIKANPIKQYIRFDQAVEAKRVLFRIDKTVGQDGLPPSIAEITLLVQ